jgi:pilus assembly protein Flp/PilA
MGHFEFYVSFSKLKIFCTAPQNMSFLWYPEHGWSSPALAVDECNIVNWRTSMRNAFRNFAQDVKGVTLIEYGLIAALIAVALATILGTVGTNLSTLFNTVSTKV